MNAKFAFGLAAAAMTSAALGNVTGANGPVTLDGKLDEACWKAAEWQGDFKVASRQAETAGNVARKPKGETQFAIVTDAENLYVGIRAEHKSMKEMCALPVGGQWASEAVELHLVPTGGEFELYQFLVCHPGQMWAMFYSEGGHIRPDPYGPAWERAIADSETGWTAEVKIPFSALYMTRNGNWAKTWRLNVGRTYKTARNGLGENSSWADVAANYSELSKFRDYGPFPMRRAEDDFLVSSVRADIRGLKGGKAAGELKVNVTLAKGGAFTFKSEYSEPAKVELKDGANEFAVPAVFPENGRYVSRFTLVREADGSVLARDFPLRVDYEPIRVKLTTPGYRNNFYPGQCADRVEGTVQVVADDEIRMTLEGPGFPTRKATLSSSGSFSFDTTGFRDGDAKLTVTCGKDTLVRKIRKLPPLPEGQHMSWIENGNLVVDGRPTVMRNIYAEGFMGGKAFDKKYWADDKLHITRHIKEIKNVDPVWIAKELKYSEMMKDVMPSQKMFDALDKAMASGRKDGTYYYGVDEPECHGISAVYLEHVYNYIAEKDPYHVLVCCCRSGEAYGRTADVFATHPYINPYQHPDGRRTYSRDFNVLGNFVDAYHPEEHPEQCIGGAPTCFGYDSGDYPTFDEYVLNYWCELVRGAKVMFPYAYHDLGDRPQLYEGTRYMFECLEALEDVILFGTRKTLVKTREYECCQWTMPAGDRVIALVNFTQKPQTVTVPDLYGAYREFRGTRTFTCTGGKATFELKPLEALIACEKAYDAGLKPLAEVRAYIDGLNRARMNRGNLLFQREHDMKIRTSTGKRGPWWDTARELFDGVLDVIGWYHNWGKERFYEITFINDLKPAFSEVRVYGMGIEDYTLSVDDGKGGWTKLVPAAIVKDGEYGIAYKFEEKVAPKSIRFDFPKPTPEVYEFELAE